MRIIKSLLQLHSVRCVKIALQLCDQGYQAVSLIQKILIIQQNLSDFWSQLCEEMHYQLFLIIWCQLHFQSAEVDCKSMHTLTQLLYSLSVCLCIMQLTIHWVFNKIEKVVDEVLSWDILKKDSFLMSILCILWFSHQKLHDI